jgi:hypothetical protein
MRFAYDGFTQDGDKRCFLFRGMEEHNPATVFAIAIDLPLLMQNHVLVQEGPMFCLQLLMNASLSGPDGLDRFQHYQVVREDLQPLLLERARIAAEKARKTPTRRPVRRSPFTPNLHLGTLLDDRSKRSFGQPSAYNSKAGEK